MTTNEPTGELSTADSLLFIRQRDLIREMTAEVERLDLALAEARADCSLLETRARQATEACTWLTNENQRLREKTP